MRPVITVVPIIEKGREPVPLVEDGYGHQPPFAPLKVPAWR